MFLIFLNIAYYTSEFFKNPDQLYNRLVLCYMNLDREDLIFNLYNTIIKDYRGSIYINEALDFNINYLFQKNNYIEAEKILHTAIKIFPRSAYYRTLLGDSFRKKGEKSRALSEYRKIIREFGFIEDLYTKISHV